MLGTGTAGVAHERDMMPHPRMPAEQGFSSRRAIKTRAAENRRSAGQ